MPLFVGPGCNNIYIEVLHSKQNICLEQTPESVTFAEWLLKVGAGSDLTPDKTIELPNNMHLPQNDVNSLVNAIYADIDQPGRKDKFFQSTPSSLPQMIQLIILTMSSLTLSLEKRLSL